MDVKLEQRDLDGMDDGQRVALLEMLVAGVLADGKTTAEEVAKFDELVRSLQWGMEPEVFEALVRGTQARVGALTSPDQIGDFVIGLAARVPSPPLREKLVFTMMAMMAADGEVDRSEKNVLGMFVLAFGITSERRNAIRQALAAERARPAGA